MTKIQKIAVLTSGGDSQGMNACLRAVTRKAIANSIEVIGVIDGYNGLINNEFISLGYKSVSNIIHRGGTILGTARSEGFKTKEYRKIAFDNLKANGVDALIVIGGDGSFKGAKLFSQEFDIPFIGIPGTIDNDIVGTEYTLGYDTALNNIISAIDKIKDTASSHHRIFLVEVMGNTSGLLAFNAALTSGAEDVFLPETKEDFNRFEQKIKLAIAAKKSSIIIVAEGDEIGGANELYQYLKGEKLHDKLRVSVLGHIQRGGAPSFKDRELGTLFGAKAIELLINNEFDQLVGLKDNKVYHYDFEKLENITKNSDFKNLALIHELSVY